MARILPSITTLTSTGTSLHSKIAEIETLGLTSVAVFLTGLTHIDRALFYTALERAQQEHFFSIPFVHAVSSMLPDEFRYLSDQFGTEAFNLHRTSDYPITHSLPNDIRAQIYIENSFSKAPNYLTPEDLEGFAGLCVDLSHLNDQRVSDPSAYETSVELICSSRVGINHISPVTIPLRFANAEPATSTHFADSGTTFRYLIDLPREALARTCALEVENPLHEQVEILPQVETFIALMEPQRTAYKQAS